MKMQGKLKVMQHVFNKEKIENTYYVHDLEHAKLIAKGFGVKMEDSCTTEFKDVGYIKFWLGTKLEKYDDLGYIMKQCMYYEHKADITI